MKLDLGIVAILISLAGTLASIFFARKKTSQEDELSLTQRIARNKIVANEMEEIAARSCEKSFVGRSPWVKELAREVFRDQLMLAVNERHLVDGRVFDEFRGNLGEHLANLSRAIEEMRKSLDAQPEQITKLLIAAQRRDSS